jgi:cobalamin biosynthesis Mg chelatase CobN
LFVVIIVVLLFVFAFGLSGGALNPPIKVVDSAPPSPTSISCTVSSTSLSKGSSINVTGSISPAVDNATVTLTYTKPDATTLVRTVTSSADGSYIDTLTPDSTGSWNVKASWAGDATTYLGSTSLYTPFTVQGSSTTGFPMDYIYVAIVVVVVVVIVASAAYWLKKKK